jgi:hypothetical protein
MAYYNATLAAGLEEVIEAERARALYAAWAKQCSRARAFGTV